MFTQWRISEDYKDLLINHKSIFIPESKEELLKIVLGDEKNKIFSVEYEYDGKKIKEATVTKCKNGIAVNYEDSYIRRRDPDCLFIADDLESDKPRLKERFGIDFKDLKRETINWLKKQDLIVMPFTTGGNSVAYDSLFIGPKNAAFFAAGLSYLQKILNYKEIKNDFKPLIIQV
ncbi:MAG: DUF4914 family protein, partial [Candidatus Goldbacteria bacterium]|nr:DUF4914 family protein [Candidatus Goldiibacteriota bacterium]